MEREGEEICFVIVKREKENKTLQKREKEMEAMDGGHKGQWKMTKGK